MTAFAFGITIGSFLNVVIWRLPRGKSLVYPSSSFCPNCEHSLRAIDLVPLLSFLIQGCKCRYCAKPISWRYFGVELLTGLTFLAITFQFWQNPTNCVTLLLFSAILIPIFFIDLDTFTIPTSLNLFVFFIPLVRDGIGILQHEPNHVLLAGWCPRSLLGAVVGIAIFGFIRVIGWVWKRQEAMGLGDVLLARGMGAFLIAFAPIGSPPLYHFMTWILLCCLSGAVVGPLMILWRQRGQKQKKAPIEEPEEENEQEYPESNSNFGEQIGAIIYCLLLGDLVEYLLDVTIAALKNAKQGAGYVIREHCIKLREHWGGHVDEDEEEFVVAPTAIPFGPFMVLGFLFTVFLGEWMAHAYLSYAFPPK